MRDINKTLKEIRPHLRQVAPLTYYTCWGFAIFNMSVAIPLFRINQETFLIVGVISLKVWALLFTSMGLLMAYALVRNDWKLTRGLMIIGVGIKASWLMELLVRATSGKSFVLATIWALLVYLQFISYLYFTPVGPRNGR